MKLSMGKVHSQPLLHSSATCNFSSKQEIFTLWMKSLVLNGKGCTVFNSSGQIVYRVDNYNCKCMDEVHLMDQRGHTLFTILRKPYSLSRFWEGYRSPPGGDTRNEKRQKGPSFRVYRTYTNSKRFTTYKAKLGLDKNEEYSHKIESSSSKSACKIYDQFGIVVAELRRKKSSCGVELGEDVLTMVVEANIDLSLIMGLVVAYTLLNSQM